MSKMQAVFTALIALLHFQMTVIHYRKPHPTEFPAFHLFFTNFPFQNLCFTHLFLTTLFFTTLFLKVHQVCSVGLKAGGCG